MEEISLLIGLGQLGIVFAGLISVFIIFAAGDGAFSPAEKQHVRGLILTSFPVVCGALLPISVHYYGAEEVQVWQISSIILLVFGTVVSVENFVAYVRLSKGDKKENGYIHATFSFGLNLVVAALLLFGSLGIAAKANYVTALFSILLIGMSSFVTFAVQRFIK